MKVMGARDLFTFIKTKFAFNPVKKEAFFLSFTKLTGLTGEHFKFPVCTFKLFCVFLEWHVSVRQTSFYTEVENTFSKTLSRFLIVKRGK